MTRMKTTIEIDESKLKRVMKLTGLKTRKAAVDYALTQAERFAKLDRFFEKPFYVQGEGEVIDPGYDVLKLRQLEKPSGR